MKFLLVSATIWLLLLLVSMLCAVKVSRQETDSANSILGFAIVVIALTACISYFAAYIVMRLYAG